MSTATGLLQRVAILLGALAAAVHTLHLKGHSAYVRSPAPVGRAET